MHQSSICLKTDEKQKCIDMHEKWYFRADLTINNKNNMKKKNKRKPHFFLLSIV